MAKWSPNWCEFLCSYDGPRGSDLLLHPWKYEEILLRCSVLNSVVVLYDTNARWLAPEGTGWKPVLDVRELHFDETGFAHTAHPTSHLLLQTKFEERFEVLGQANLGWESEVVFKKLVLRRK